MKKIVLPPERGNLWSEFDWKANRGPENQQGREGCDDRVFATHEKNASYKIWCQNKAEKINSKIL